MIEFKPENISKVLYKRIEIKQKAKFREDYTTYATGAEKQKRRR